MWFIYANVYFYLTGIKLHYKRQLIQKFIIHYNNTCTFDEYCQEHKPADLNDVDNDNDIKLSNVSELGRGLVRQKLLPKSLVRLIAPPPANKAVVRVCSKARSLKQEEVKELYYRRLEQLKKMPPRKRKLQDQRLIVLDQTDRLTFMRRFHAKVSACM